MINRRFARKLTTVSLAGILTASMSVVAFAGPAMGQPQMAPPAQLQEGEEPPAKPEGDLAPEKPEGDLAPEKPEGAEELMEPPVDEDGNVIAPPEKPSTDTDESENENVTAGSVNIINRARTALQNMASSIGSWFGGIFK